MTSGASGGPDPLGGPPPAVFLVGATASGKGAVAYGLARSLGAGAAEIVSLDSMKIYRGLDAGTNKPGADLRRAVPTHLLDVVSPSEEYSVERYRAAALTCAAGIRGRGARPLFAGGTPLYLRALVSGLFSGPSADAKLREGLEREAGERGAPSLHARLTQLDPDAAARIHPNDLRRVVRALEVFEVTGMPISRWQREWGTVRTDVVLVGIRRGRDDLRSRISERVDRIFEAGLEAETRSLLAAPGGLSRTAAQALGTRQVLGAIEGRFSMEEAKRRTVRETLRYARQQLAWFRRYPGLVWFDVEPGTSLESTVERAASAVREAESRLTASRGRTSRS